MKKIDFTKAVNTVKKFRRVHKPEIRSAESLIFFLAAEVFVGIASYKASKKIERLKEENNGEVTTMDVVKTVGPSFIPAVASTAAGIALSANSTHEWVKKCTGLATACASYDTMLKDFKDKTAEVVGEKKEREIENEIIKDNASKADISRPISTKYGNTLCFDNFTGRYFYSDIDAIKNQLNEFNDIALTMGMNGDEAANYNLMCDLMGLPYCGVGETNGWLIRSTGDFIKLRPSSFNEPGTDTPVFVVAFNRDPKQIDMIDGGWC